MLEIPLKWFVLHTPIEVGYVIEEEWFVKNNESLNLSGASVLKDDTLMVQT